MCPHVERGPMLAPTRPASLPAATLPSAKNPVAAPATAKAHDMPVCPPFDGPA